MMISAQTDPGAQEHLIEKYMALPNQVWDGVINQATQVKSLFWWQVQREKKISKKSIDVWIQMS